MNTNETINESIEGAESVVEFYRNQPGFEPMKSIGAVEALTPGEAVNRAAALYGIEPSTDGFKALMSPFKGASEILMVELVNVSSTNIAKTILKHLDDAFKERGLDLKEQTYPILDMTPTYPSSYGNGNVTFIAFVPVIKSPDEPIENSEPDIHLDPPEPADVHAEPEPEPKSEPEPADTPGTPEAKPEDEPEPTKPEPGRKTDRPKPSRINIHVDFKRRKKISDAVVSKRLETTARSAGFEKDANGTLWKEGAVGKYKYIVFMEKNARTAGTLRSWKKTGRCAVPSKKLTDDISLNDMCLCIGFVFDTRTFNQNVMKDMTLKVLDSLKDDGFAIRNRKAFIVSVGNPYSKTPERTRPT